MDRRDVLFYTCTVQQLQWAYVLRCCFRAAQLSQPAGQRGRSARMHPGDGRPGQSVALNARDFGKKIEGVFLFEESATSAIAINALAMADVDGWQGGEPPTAHTLKTPKHFQVKDPIASKACA